MCGAKGARKLESFSTFSWFFGGEGIDRILFAWETLPFRHIHEDDRDQADRKDCECERNNQRCHTANFPGTESSG